MAALSVIRSPVIAVPAVPARVCETTTVGVLAATVMLTGVSETSVSPGFGPPFVAVTLNCATYPAAATAAGAVNVGLTTFAFDSVTVGAPFATWVQVYESGPRFG